MNHLPTLPINLKATPDNPAILTLAEAIAARGLFP